VNRFTGSQHTDPPSVNALLDRLVELYYDREQNALVTHSEAVAILRDLLTRAGDSPPELVNILQRKTSDLLAPFGARCGALPNDGGDKYERAFGHAIEWIRCYFDPQTDRHLLLQESATLALDQIQSRHPSWSKLRNLFRPK
jgi:hypothetical protein